jgi:hypothetical protein
MCGMASSSPVTGRDGGLVVGRDSELELLAGNMSKAISGSGSLVLVSGEAGLGKTTLCDAFERMATATVNKQRQEKGETKEQKDKSEPKPSVGRVLKHNPDAAGALPGLATPPTTFPVGSTASVPVDV